MQNMTFKQLWEPKRSIKITDHFICTSANDGDGDEVITILVSIWISVDQLNNS